MKPSHLGTSVHKNSWQKHPFLIDSNVNFIDKALVTNIRYIGCLYEQGLMVLSCKSTMNSILIYLNNNQWFSFCNTGYIVL